VRPHSPSVLLAFLAVLAAGVQGNFQLCEHRGHDHRHLTVAQDHEHGHECGVHGPHGQDAPADTPTDRGPACVDHRAVDLDPWSVPPATVVAKPVVVPSPWLAVALLPTVHLREAPPAAAPRARPPPRPGRTAPLLI